MKEILEKGDLTRLNRSLIFKCEDSSYSFDRGCGCKFKADKEDYNHECSQYDNVSYYWTNCPECGSYCSLSEEEAKRQWGGK